jgi:hypothetical protein
MDERRVSVVAFEMGDTAVEVHFGFNYDAPANGATKLVKWMPPFLCVASLYKHNGKVFSIYQMN